MRPTTCVKRPVKFSHYHGANVTLTDQYKTAVGEYTHAQGQFMLSENLRPGDRFEFDLHGAGIVKIQGFGSKNEAQSWFRSKQPLGRGCIRIRTQKTLRYSVSVPLQGNEITLISKTGKRQDQLAGSILAFDIECGDVQVILFKSSNVTFDTINQSKHVEVSNTLRNCTATLKHANPLALCTPSSNCSLRSGKIFILRVKGPENDRATGSYVRICVAGQPSLYCNQGDEKCVGTSQCPQVKGKRLTARAKMVYEYILRVDDNVVSVERYVREPIQQINLIEMLPASSRGDCALWFELHRVSIQLSEYRVKDDFDSPPNYRAPPPPIPPVITSRRTNQSTVCYDKLGRCAQVLSSMASSSSSHDYISIQNGDETSSYVSADSETNRSFEEQYICHAAPQKMAFGEVRLADEYGISFDADDSERTSVEPTTLTNNENNETRSFSNDSVYDPNHFRSDRRSNPMPIPPKPHYRHVSRDPFLISCGTLASEKCPPSVGYETPGELTESHPKMPGTSSATKKQSCPENVFAGRSPHRLRTALLRSKSFSPGNLHQTVPCEARCTRDPLYPARADSRTDEQCRRWLDGIDYRLGGRSPSCSDVYGEWARPATIDENIPSVSQVIVNSDEESSFYISYCRSSSQPRISHNIHLQEIGAVDLHRFSGDTLPTASFDMRVPPAIPPRSSNYVNGKLTVCPAKVKSESDICVACSRKSETFLKNIENGSLCSSSPSEMSIDEETFAKVPSHKHLEPSRTLSLENTEDGDETFTKSPFQNELSKVSEDSGSASSVQIRERKITGRNIVESSNINESPTPAQAECVAVLQPSPVVTLGEQGGFQRSNTYRRNINTPTPPCIKKCYPSKGDLGK